MHGRVRTQCDKLSISLPHTCRRFPLALHAITARISPCVVVVVASSVPSTAPASFLVAVSPLTQRKHRLSTNSPSKVAGACTAHPGLLSGVVVLTGMLRDRGGPATAYATTFSRVHQSLDNASSSTATYLLQPVHKHLPPRGHDAHNVKGRREQPRALPNAVRAHNTINSTTSSQIG